MSLPTAEFILNPRKQPVQQRSRRTFQEIVSAGDELLRRRGYVGVTTNHIAAQAGVNIATLYEYFPGKDAIVAQVIESMVDRMFDGLERSAEAALESGQEMAVKSWIRSIYTVTISERDLLEVLYSEVPFAGEIPAVQNASTRWLELAFSVRDGAGTMVSPDFNEYTLRLSINLVASTMYQLAIQEDCEDTINNTLEELTHRLEGWILNPR